ncbi:MAG: geranylgeranylglycerol-phosphate geranylgeranyltransferase [Chitinophagales bacterium]|nr:geranylgeranylglycerol-phosphate geranylgeranyltransferase [Chitinophagales bacterium]MDW8418224.1 geranylgeranylglycerol-phosphate geranylgeranyltransferase [Chitinophagales bacterium]
MLKNIRLWLSLLRAVNLLFLALTLTFFYYCLIVPNHYHQLYTKLLPLTTIDFVLFVVSVMLVAAAGNIINDYYDFELDRAHKPHRALPQGLISLNTALLLHAVLAITGIGIAFYISYSYNYSPMEYVYMLAVLLLYAYASSLKKVAFAGNVLIALLTATPLWLLFLMEVKFLATIHFEFAPRILGLIRNAVIFYSGFAFLTNLARELVKDLQDEEGDKEFGINTLPVLYGTNTARWIAALILLTMLSGLGYFMKGFWDMRAMKEFFYLLTLVVVPTIGAIGLIFTAKNNAQWGIVSALLKFIMLAGIGSMPAFYYFGKGDL